MNITTKSLLTGLLAFLVGSGATYLMLDERTDDRTGHRMADGSMMHGSMDMEGEMAGMMQGLDGKTGDAFDQAFLKEMIVHHEGAVAMAEAALKAAEHQEIRDLAQGIIAAQNSEIESMKGWQKAWYGK